MKTEEKLASEYKTAHEASKASHRKVEPTAEEIKNGWDKESLNAYLVEQHASQSLRVSMDSLQRKNARRPIVQNHKYNPHRWRG